MILTCINLRERFGRRYRTGFDDAAGNRDDPWMMTIPGRFGTIYPHGRDRLAVEVDGHPRIAKQVAAIPGIVLHQDGDDEKTFVFPVDLFDQVAAIVEPKRVKRLTDEQRARLVEAGQLYRFQAGDELQFRVGHPRMTGQPGDRLMLKSVRSRFHAGCLSVALDDLLNSTGRERTG